MAAFANGERFVSHCYSHTTM